MNKESNRPVNSAVYIPLYATYASHTFLSCLEVPTGPHAPPPGQCPRPISRLHPLSVGGSVQFPPASLSVCQSRQRLQQPGQHLHSITHLLVLSVAVPPCRNCRTRGRPSIASALGTPWCRTHLSRGWRLLHRAPAFARDFVHAGLARHGGSLRADCHCSGVPGRPAGQTD